MGAETPAGRAPWYTIRMSATFVATTSPAYVRQALSELRAIDPGLRALGALAPGVIRFACSPQTEREGFLARLRSEEPIFVRHLHPIDRDVALVGGELDQATLLAAAAELFGTIEPGERIAVHVRLFREEGPGPDRGQVREQLAELVRRSGGEPVVQNPARILSVTADEAVAALGLAAPAENLSDWPGGEMRFRREDEQVSRAAFKLLEALERFGLEVGPGQEALDLGAAPGGWSHVLLQRGLAVTAVDTGELAPSVLTHPRLTFLRQNAETVQFEPQRFDLLTCDLSWNPLNTARMVLRLAPSARPGAHLILTVKLMLANPTRTIRQVSEILSEGFRLVQTKQLFHNRDEVTMHLIRK